MLDAMRIEVPTVAPYATLSVGSAGDVAAVVSCFDGCLEEDLDIDAVLSRAAGIAGCVVGVSASQVGGHRAASPAGQLLSVAPGQAVRRPFVGGGEVWIARRGGLVELDDVLLERLAVVCSVTLRPPRSVEAVGPAALEVVLSPETGDVERFRALRTLGIEPTSEVTLLAYDGVIAEAADLIEYLQTTMQVRVGAVASIHVLMLCGILPDDAAAPRGARIGVGLPAPALEAARAWRQALTALRFALPSAHGRAEENFVEALMVPYAKLGAFALLAEHLPIDCIADNADLSAVDRLAAAPGGGEMMRTLETVAATESFRRAASHLHLHHNSVAHRVARAESELGFEVNAPYGRARLLLALVVQRLRDNARHLG